jgi:CheY-like chemotaxis protein
MMKPYGLQVDCVTSGQQAVRRLQEEEVIYDAVFMDHMMPEMDGIEAVRLIRSIGTEYARNVPIIALTANAIIGNEKMFLNKGFQSFLSKPIDVTHLDAIMRQWVRKEATESESAATPASEIAFPVKPETEAASGAILAAVAGIEGMNTAVCAECFGGDSAVYLQVLRSYAASTAPLLARICAVSPEPPADYAVIVHGLKGSSRGVGAEVIGDMAAELEQAAGAGDIEFILRKNEEFVTAAAELLRTVTEILGPPDGNKPVKDAPDQTLLTRLREHCAGYDMDGIDEVMTELDGFIYEKQADLVAWLREKIALMEFAEINDHLSAAM